MRELDDHELLSQYAGGESEAAFGALVERHVNLVYCAALRFTGNAHHAQEITQAVFIILARKSGCLRRGTVLSGWLYQTARLTAANFIKGETRRQRREQEAYMQSTVNEPDLSGPGGAAAEAAWEQIAPLLEEAMGRLGETDRNAVVLRFFENRTAREVGAALKLSEAAAHKRVNRALEKLRKFFAKRSLVLTTTILAAAVSAHSVQAAPMGLAATVLAAAAKGTPISVTIATLVRGTMKTMTWLKLKLAAGAGVAALLVGGVAAVATSGDQVATASADKSISTNQSRILITGLFVKTPTANVDAILKEFAPAGIPTDPGSKAFRDLMLKHPGVTLYDSASFIATNGVSAKASLVQAVTINGTNANAGRTLEVTPEIQRDSRTVLRIRAEFRELMAGPPPSIRITETTAQTLPLTSGHPVVVSAKIGGGGATAGDNQDDPSETLLVIVNATHFTERLHRIIKRN